MDQTWTKWPRLCQKNCNFPSSQPAVGRRGLALTLPEVPGNRSEHQGHGAGIGLAAISATAAVYWACRPSSAIAEAAPAAVRLLHCHDMFTALR